MKSSRLSNSSFLLITATLTVGLLSTGCTTSGGGEEGAETSNVEVSDGGESTNALTAQCGVIASGKKYTNLSFDSAELVSVRALEPDLVVITRKDGEQAGNQQLVALQGLSANDLSTYERQKGVTLINKEARTAYFVSGGAECNVTVDGGGQGIIGQIFSPTGQNINELLISKGAAKASGDDGCGGAELKSCYDSITVEKEFSTTVVHKFLWKPSSDGGRYPGKLVLLVDAYGVKFTVESNGRRVEMDDHGPGVGYGSIGRTGQVSGCDMGSAKVTMTDAVGRIVRFSDGQEFIIGGGCSRKELGF